MIEVSAEVTGSVWKIQVEVGQSVEADDEVMILESMKMEFPAEAPEAGIVSEIKVREGDSVAEGDVLVLLDGGTG